MVEVSATINRSMILKTYNQSNIEQLCQCSVRISHNDKFVKCRFFVVPDDNQTLHEMPDIELFDIIEGMCDTIVK